MNDKKRYLYVSVTDEMFEIVAGLINQTGYSIPQLFENAIFEYARVLEGKGRILDPFLRISLAAREAQKHTMNLDQLRNVAYRYASSPSDEKLAELVELCDSVGVDVSSILEDTSKNEKVVEYIKEHGQLNKAEQWLINNVKRDMGIAANKLREKSEKELGCSWETVCRAKRNLGIESKKVKGGIFIWHWPVEEEIATEEELYVGEV